MVLIQNKYKNTIVCVLRTKITFVLRYTPHSGDKALTQVIWVLRKPSCVF